MTIKSNCIWKFIHNANWKINDDICSSEQIENWFLFSHFKFNSLWKFCFVFKNKIHFDESSSSMIIIIWFSWFFFLLSLSRCWSLIYWRKKLGSFYSFLFSFASLLHVYFIVWHKWQRPSQCSMLVVVKKKTRKNPRKFNFISFYLLSLAIQHTKFFFQST